MGHPRKENTTANAERCKAYRSKTKEECKLNDPLRKMIVRQKIKQNLIENRQEAEERSCN